MLPAYEKLKIRKSLELKYTNLNEKNFKKALLIESIKYNYPDQLIDYLISRAECLFEQDGMELARQMNMESEKIINYMESSICNQKTKTNFIVSAVQDCRILVNEIYFELIPTFYIGSGEPSLYQTNSETCNWNFDCLSHKLNNYLQVGLKAGDLRKSSFDKYELVFNQKDIYTFLIACSATNNPSLLTRIDNIIHLSFGS